MSRSSYQDYRNLQFSDCYACNGYTNNNFDYIYYTDGSCSGNHQTRTENRRAGMGIYMIQNRQISHFRQNLDQCEIQHPVTNNTAEMQAVRLALEIASNSTNKTIAICTDSEYVLDAICRGYVDWRGGYTRNGKKNEHWALICQIRRAMDNFQQVQFFKCSSHRQYTCHGNKRADELAVEARDKRGHQGYINGNFIR